MFKFIFYPSNFRHEVKFYLLQISCLKKRKINFIRISFLQNDVKFVMAQLPALRSNRWIAL